MNVKDVKQVVIVGSGFMAHVINLSLWPYLG